MFEIRNVRQIPGEHRRRWFSSERFDLIVWFSEAEGITGFELCYDKQCSEHAIAWDKHRGFQHMAVDDGEQRIARHKASPVLIPDGFFDAERVHAQFAEACVSLPMDIADLVLAKLQQHPNFSSKP